MGRLLGIVIVTAIVAALVPGRFGGGHEQDDALRWQAPPRTSPVAGTAGDHLLFARVVNHSDHALRLRAADVHILDRDGDRLRTTAAFADGFVPGVTLSGYGSEVYGAPAGPPVGREVVLQTGGSAPLSVSFTARPDQAPAAVEYGGGRLALE